MATDQAAGVPEKNEQAGGEKKTDIQA